MDVTLETLVANRDWLRRLAAALVRDHDLAEDLAQETWEATLRHPPRARGDRTSARGWLRTVLVNRLRNERRGRTRREVREAAHAAPDPVVTPEEMTARLELQRRLCVLVTTLSEAQRQVLYLGFFEDRTSPEIARLIGVPEGTVRWRLKTALDELRARLDDEHGGERRRWRALLLPLVAVEPPRAAAVPPRPRALTVLAGALVAGAAAIMLVRGFLPAPPSSHPIAAHRRGMAALSSLPGPPRFATAVEPAVDVTTCPDLQPLRDEIAVRTRELEATEPPQQLFARGEPNPTAEERFGAVWKPLVGTPPRCPYTFACRGIVCRAQVLAPLSDPRGVDACFATPTDDPRTYRDWPLRDHLATRSGSIGNATPVRDPVSGESFTRFDLHYRLRDPSGAPVAQQPPPPELALAPGRRRPLPDPPAERAPACKREVDRLRAELEVILDRGDQNLSPEQAFAVNAPNPAVTAEVLRALPEVTGLAGDPFPLTVECRGTVCALAPRDPNDPRTAIKRICEQRSDRPFCRIDPDHDGWFARLDRLGLGHDLFARVSPPKPPGSTAYLRIRSAAERARLNPMVAACDLTDRLHAADVLGTCGRTEVGGGTLRLKLTIPGPDAPQRHITVDDGGDAAGTPVGRCVVERLRALAAALEVPPTRHSLVIHLQPTLPAARELWRVGRNPCRRR